MRLTKMNGRFVLRSEYAERHIPKGAGFRWDPQARQWWTDDVTKAAKLAAYADPIAAPEVGAAAAAREAALAASRATDAAIELPVPAGQALLPYQRAGVAFLLGHPSALVADEMGLGKTIQALVAINADPTMRRVLVVCPATLRLNWQREAERWLTRPMPVTVAVGSECPVPAAEGVLVINYDILARHLPALLATTWDMVVVDECHYAKNPRAKRSQAVYALKARRRVLLTGTPIVNRPVELFPLLHYLDPAAWPHFFRFAKRYCNAFHNGYGWDFSGASNLDELQDRLRTTLMVRRLKAEVLTELPAKRHQVIELPRNGCAAAVEAENAAAIEAVRAAGEPCESYEDAAKAIASGRVKIDFTEMSAARHALAVAKVPAVVATVRDTLEQVEKLVVFAHHRVLIDALVTEFGAAAVAIHGDTPMSERQAAVDRFQSDPTCTLFVGSITAAAEGITLTAASTVIMAELDWRPGKVTQAEDRLHRIGQRNSVLVQYLVVERSLDAVMAKVIAAKAATAGEALGDAPAPVEPTPPVGSLCEPEPEPTRVNLDALKALVPEGWYAVPSATGNNDLDFFCVQHGQGRWEGRIYVSRVIGGRTNQRLAFGQYAGVLQRIVDAGAREAKAAFGRAIGRCGHCGRHLTDEESRALGLGPVCAARA